MSVYVCMCACVCVWFAWKRQPLTKDVPSSHLYTQSLNIKMFVKCKYFYSLPSFSSSNPAPSSADARRPSDSEPSGMVLGKGTSRSQRAASSCAWQPPGTQDWLPAAGSSLGSCFHRNWHAWDGQLGERYPHWLLFKWSLHVLTLASFPVPRPVLEGPGKMPKYQGTAGFPQFPELWGTKSLRQNLA